MGRRIVLYLITVFIIVAVAFTMYRSLINRPVSEDFYFQDQNTIVVSGDTCSLNHLLTLWEDPEIHISVYSCGNEYAALYYNPYISKADSVVFLLTSHEWKELRPLLRTLMKRLDVSIKALREKEIVEYSYDIIDALREAPFLPYIDFPVWNKIGTVVILIAFFSWIVWMFVYPFKQEGEL